MALILVLATIALVAGSLALVTAMSDFKNGTTFRSSTAAAIYLGWSFHAVAFLAALLLDPYRVAAGEVPAITLGILLSGSGMTLFVLGVRRFESFGHVTGTEVGGLVTSGVYSVSRNPQYTGWILILTGAAVAARSPAAVALAVAVLLAMAIWIPHEERHLEEEFGEEYRHYRRQVPRFIGVG